MGTRGLVIVKLNNEYKVANYQQFDSYPDGVGAELVKILNSLDTQILKDKVKSCFWITKDELLQLWKSCGADEDGYASLEASDKFKKLYPHLHRSCGANIIEHIYDSQGPLKIYNSLDFAADSLFCEWAYVVDFDKNTFEVFKGFNKIPLTVQDRFYFLEKNEYKSNNYYPIKLVKQYELNNLPTPNMFTSDFIDKDIN